MNAEERKELKRAIEGRESWRIKAVARSNENHFLKEKIRDIDVSRSRWRSRAETAEEELKKTLLLLTQLQQSKM